MADNIVDCNCCFSSVDIKFTVECNAAHKHTFCYECIFSYMSVGLQTGSIHLSCIQKRACNGDLDVDNIVELMKCAAVKFSDNVSTSELQEREVIGTIVNCYKCNKRIRKLAFYNYVSCECGTVVCYGCGQEIIDSIRKHPCGSTNSAREPRWYSPLQTPIDSADRVSPRSSRRFRAHSIAASLEVQDTSLVLHSSFEQVNRDNSVYLDNLNRMMERLDTLMAERRLEL